MGYGDDIMITAHATNLKKKFPERQIVIGNIKKKEAYHSVVYDNNPNIADCRNVDLKKPIHIIDYHEGNRPYIDYKKSLASKKYVWNKNFKPTPGELYFTKEENIKANEVIDRAIKFWKKIYKKKAEKIIFIETSSTKIDDYQYSIKHKNKDWGHYNWINLINEIKDKYLIIQSVHHKSKKIDGVYSDEKINFRLACAVINKCNLYVGPEGGFGHVAAALKKNAVIYFGGWISPSIIGYDSHYNIYYDNKESPCGEFKKLCSHCEIARKNIKVDTFKEYIKKAL